MLKIFGKIYPVSMFRMRTNEKKKNIGVLQNFFLSNGSNRIQCPYFRFRNQTSVFYKGNQKSVWESNMNHPNVRFFIMGNQPSRIDLGINNGERCGNQTSGIGLGIKCLQSIWESTVRNQTSSFIYGGINLLESNVWNQ